MKSETINILKSFSNINKSIKIRKGNEISIFSSVHSQLAVAQIDDTFDREFSIYDLNQWLATISLFDNPVFKYEDRYMTISNESGGISAKYRYSNDIVTSDQPLPSKLPNSPTIFSFTFTNEQLQKTIKASSILSSELICITPTSVKAFSRNKDNESSDNEYITQTDSSTVEVIDEYSPLAKNGVCISVNSLKVIPNEYKVSVKEKMVVFESIDGKLKYVIGIAKNV